MKKTYPATLYTGALDAVILILLIVCHSWEWKLLPVIALH